MKTLMKSLVSASILIIAALLLAGCPYSSSVPLSEPSEAVDPGLYGKWLKDSGDENPDYYDIEEIDGISFNLTKFTWDSEALEYSMDTRYTSWFTTIGDVRFINIEDVDDPGTYYFYKLEMPTADSFVLFEVTDNIDEEFTDSDEIYEFFDAYKHLSFFYNTDEETYLREGGKQGGPKA